MDARTPEISLVIPAYNEEASLKRTILSLTEGFAKEHIALQLMLVDNGSTDGTGGIIDELIAEGLPVTKVTVGANRGYGYGILQGLERCRAPLVGFLHADGQVSAADVALVYRLALGRGGSVLAKARRKFRQDGWQRHIVSSCYNGIMRIFFGPLGARDLNASPKVWTQKDLRTMRLASEDWFLDAEIMIKAMHLGFKVFEVDVEGRARQGGMSKVRFGTCVEFLKNIVRYRFGGRLRAWLHDVEVAQVIDRRRSMSELVDGPQSLPNAAQDDANVSGDVSLHRVRVVRQPRYEDTRGFLQKVLTSSQCKGVLPRGEVYVSAAHQGEAKGNHFHLRMGEWFGVVQGSGVLELCDPTSGERQSIPLGVSQPCVVYVPSGLAHALVNTGECLLICVAVAEVEHDPEDVFPYPVWPLRSSLLQSSGQ